MSDKQTFKQQSTTQKSKGIVKMSSEFVAFLDTALLFPHLQSLTSPFRDFLPLGGLCLLGRAE